MRVCRLCEFRPYTAGGGSLEARRRFGQLGVGGQRPGTGIALRGSEPALELYLTNPTPEDDPNVARASERTGGRRYLRDPARRTLNESFGAETARSAVEGRKTRAIRRF
jgi:hypothetical protein